MEELKKVYKIGDTIEKSELLEVSKGITKKALKVIEASGNKFATNIIEGKDKDTFEDLVQSVAVALIENNYTITKNCYKIVNKYINDYRKNNTSQVIINIIDKKTGKQKKQVKYINNYCLDNESDINAINTDCYLEYITTDFTQKTSQKSNVTSLKSIYNMLTPRQAEILKIYTNLREYYKDSGLFRYITPSDTKRITRYKTKIELLYSVKQKAVKI